MPLRAPPLWVRRQGDQGDKGYAGNDGREDLEGAPQACRPELELPTGV